jgi:hypothetical protein
LTQKRAPLIPRRPTAAGDAAANLTATLAQSRARRHREEPAVGIEIGAAVI